MKSHFIAGLFVLNSSAVIPGFYFSAFLGMLWSIPSGCRRTGAPNTCCPMPARSLCLTSFLWPPSFSSLPSGFRPRWASKHYFGKQILEVITHLIERIQSFAASIAPSTSCSRLSPLRADSSFPAWSTSNIREKAFGPLPFVTGPAQLPPQVRPEEPLLNIYVRPPPTRHRDST